MKQFVTAGFTLLAFFAVTAAAQDWYHDREARFQGEQWRAHGEGEGKRGDQLAGDRDGYTEIGRDLGQQTGDGITFGPDGKRAEREEQ